MEQHVGLNLILTVKVVVAQKVVATVVELVIQIMDAHVVKADHL